MKMRLAGLVVLMLLAGCGGGTSEQPRAAATVTVTATVTATPAPSQPATSVRHDESEIIKALKLEGSPGGGEWTYTAPGGQARLIAVVMTDAESVSMYADAGDPVAKNPAGTVGLKVVDAETKTCLALLNKALVNVELVKLAQDFWMELVPLISVLERQDDAASQLNRVRMALFNSIWHCQVLAGAELQKALHRLGDAAENVGHRPYADEPGREQAWRHELYEDAHSAAKLVEAAVRRELDLPARVPYEG